MISEQQNKIQIIQQLIEILSQPDHKSKKVYELCAQLNIPYSGDDIELMSLLLSSHSHFKVKTAQQNKSVKSKKLISKDFQIET